MNTQQIDKRAGASPKNHAPSGGRKITSGYGFEAHSYQHADFQGLMDPVIMVDHRVTTQPTFGIYADGGLSAVTAMVADSEGAFRSRDCLGNDLDAAPGDFSWFKAASVTIHNKTPRPGALTHAWQVLVNLAAENRHDAPAAFQNVTTDRPRLPGEHASARRILCKASGVLAAAAPDIPLTLFDIVLQAGGQFAHFSDGSHPAWSIAIKGPSKVMRSASSAELQPGKSIAFAAEDEISLSSEAGAQVVLFRGRPFRQALVPRGPFAMGNADGPDAVEADDRAGRFGSMT